MTETFEERAARLDRYEARIVAGTKALWEVLDDPELSDHEPLLTSLQGALEWLEILSTCGDCVEGRCHWGGERSRKSIAAAEAGQEYVDPMFGRCGCDKHEFSVQVRHRRARLKATTEPEPSAGCPSLHLHNGKLVACSRHGAPDVHEGWADGEWLTAWGDTDAVPSPWPKDQEPPAGIDVLRDTNARDGGEGYLCRVRERGEWAWRNEPRAVTSLPVSRSHVWAEITKHAIGGLVVVRP
jgi:hypothetical protein